MTNEPAPRYSLMLERAIRWAAQFHRNQNRKASDVPYITHPAAVATILQRYGFDDDAMLAAALLHDVVEDTECTLEEIAEAFPEAVTQYVTALSEEKEDATGHKRPWLDRKRDHMAVIANSGWQVRAIVLADKLHNLTSMRYDQLQGEELWSRFSTSREQLLWYHREMVAAAAKDDERLQELVAACQGLIEELETE